MDTSDNNEKSKIEQIRIDLEKKFAAIEMARLKKMKSKESDNDLDKSDDEKIKTVKEEVKVVDTTIEDIESVDIVLGEGIVKEEIEAEKEIITPLKETVNEKEEKIDNMVSKVVTSSVSNKELQEKITRVIKEPLKEKETDVEKSEANIEKNISTIKPKYNPKEKDTNKNVIPLTNEAIDDNELITEEEASKSSKIGYLIYGIAGILLLLTGYFVLDYYKDTKTFEQEKMEKLISKYKNKSYLDSIELVDANNQLLDYQNQQFIDSIANAYKLELEGGDRNAEKNISRKDNNSNVKVTKENKINKTKAVTKEVASNTNERKNDVASTTTETEQKRDAINNNSITENRDNKDLGNTTEKEADQAKEVAADDKVKEATIKEVEKQNSQLSNKEMTKKVGFTKSPVYPGCAKKRSEVEKKKCLTSKMLRHIQRKFNSDLVQDIGLKQGINKIKVSFVIDKNGYANVLQVRTKNKQLEKEAIRVIQSLPQMIPGKINGRISQMKYVIPIQFKVNN